jgi:phage tail sheath protein FI
VEDRADAIAIIDPEKGGYQPSTETKSDFKTRITNNSVALAVEAIKNRGLNTSYGCAYYPWVKIYDEINDKQVWVPPSVVALGTFASTQARSELWFAPAGFTRGGLTEGSAGLPVLGVSQRLSSKDRDDLYENNINPIAQFPAEGIVIFGQKTLQVTPSALDRINVRRLMVFLKKQISIIASRLIFDQNVQATWNRFRGQVEPFLEGVKARLGLVDFRVILDDTTTTPELIDRNIMYAKIFLKPARSIEFIAIDFVITNSGASFDD